MGAAPATHMLTVGLRREHVLGLQTGNILGPQTQTQTQTNTHT